MTASPYENDGAACSWFQDNTTNNGTISTPTMTIQRQSTNGDRVILKLVDENGTPFNPANNGLYIPRGDRSSFENLCPLPSAHRHGYRPYLRFPELTPFPIWSRPPRVIPSIIASPVILPLSDPGYAPTAGLDL